MKNKPEIKPIKEDDYKGVDKARVDKDSLLKSIREKNNTKTVSK